MYFLCYDFKMAYGAYIHESDIHTTFSLKVKYPCIEYVPLSYASPSAVISKYLMEAYIHGQDIHPSTKIKISGTRHVPLSAVESK